MTFNVNDIIRSKQSGLEYTVVGVFGDFLLCTRLIVGPATVLHQSEAEAMPDE